MVRAVHPAACVIHAVHPLCVLGAVVEGPDSPHVEPVVKAVSAVHEEGMGPLSVRLE